MDEIPIFRQSDFNNLEFVRSIVLNRLKRQPDWSQFDIAWDSRFQNFVGFEKSELRLRFVVLAQEVMWQFIIQGIITPGTNSSNINLPFFRVTTYGQEVLKQEKYIPHDPTNYLSELKTAAKTTLGKVAITYIEEALRCFTSGCHMASVLLLGVAAECVLLKLCSIVRATLKDVGDQSAFDKLPDQVRPKHRWVANKYQALPSSVRRNQLPESLDTTFISLYELIRRQRNDLGHPQDDPPSIDRERAFIFFRTFPGFVEDVEAFAEYCKTNGL